MARSKKRNSGQNLLKDIKTSQIPSQTGAAVEEPRGQAGGKKNLGSHALK